jgi:hypothetical protein
MNRGFERKPGGTTLTQLDHDQATIDTPVGAPGKRTLTEQLVAHPNHSEHKNQNNDEHKNQNHNDNQHAPDQRQPGLRPEQRRSAQLHVADDVVMEQIAHRLAYLDGDLPPRERDTDAHQTRHGDAEQAEAERPWSAPRQARLDTADRIGFRELGFDTSKFQFFTGQAGLQFWILPVLPDAKLTPVIAFRGTATVMDVAEDVNRIGIGMGQFTMNQAAIAAAVRQLARGRGAVATGHSLGGALAQIAACYFPDAIVSVVTFQSPGIRRDVVERLRALPADQQPTARHHRVHGDLVDDAGESFVPGRVTLHGTRPSDPVTAHTANPVLSQRRAEPGALPAFVRGDADPNIGASSRTGTTADPDFGRPLAASGLAEGARTHPSLAGRGLGLAGGGVLAGLFGPAVGAVATPVLSGLGGLGGAYLSHRVAPDEAYARIWLDLERRADAADHDLAHLRHEFIVEPCTKAGYTEHIQPMMDNLVRLYPEYPAIQFVAEHQVAALHELDAFVAAVRARVPELSPAALARLQRMFPRYRRHAAQHSSADAPRRRPDGPYVYR